MARASQFLATLSHLRATQVYWRIRYRLRAALGGIKSVPVTDDDAPLDIHAIERLQGWARSLAQWCPPNIPRLQQARQGTFTYLNTAATTSAGKVPWDQGNPSRLWQYELQYCSFIRDLTLDNSTEAWDDERQQCIDWMHDWIDAHPLSNSIAWEAYPTSVRLMHWALACAVFRIDDIVITRSMREQLTVLAQSLEYDIQANHLFRNAAAMTVAGALLDETTFNRGMKLLEEQVTEQLLPDGSHYEGSPHYHLQVLLDLLMVQDVCEKPPKWLRDAAYRMGAALGTMLHPDGDVAHFNDSMTGAWPQPDGILALCGERCGTTGTAMLRLADMGLCRLGPGDGVNVMLAKVGAPGPDHQLGHAHNDFGSFELSLEGQRVFVNCGTHGYAESPHRNLLRSVAAHNTAQVNGLEQLDCWSTFRVGRRYRVKQVQWQHSLQGVILRGSHDGYAPCQHERLLQWLPGMGWWVEDDFESKGTLKGESYLHLHPQYRFEQREGGYTVHDTSDRIIAQVLVAEDITSEILTGADGNPLACYHPAFGVQEPAAVLVMRRENAQALQLRYAIVPGNNTEVTWAQFNDASGEMSQ